MSLARYRYGIIGTGRQHGTDGATGFGMAHAHCHGFQETGKVDLVAVADIREENARIFVEKYQSSARIYTDYREMLAGERLDLLSICTWPHLHAPMTIAACEAKVRAIHCEKPMAPTWGEARRIKAAADASGTVLTFNHQRRFLEPFQKARSLVESGAIGELRWLEAQCSNLYDWGTHWFDMLFFLNGETPVEWILGQIDRRTEYIHYGVQMENQGLAHWKWSNGVRGLMLTGAEADLGCAIRLRGTEGSLEIGWRAPVLRIHTTGDAVWRDIESVEGISDSIAIDRAALDLVQALDVPGHRPLLHVDNALRATELIFATYESCRRRGRVDLPLTVEDSALLALIEDGFNSSPRRA